MIQGIGKNPAVDVKSDGLSQKKDSASAPQENFGEVWKKIQSQYGARPEKPREIKKTLGKDDFMRIMITQMRHQDPTEPFKAEQMAQEMAQFASVEQLNNLNQAMTKMANQNQPLERLAMTNLIGKTVTVDRGRFPHTERTNENLAFSLPADASSVQLLIRSDGGETILEKDLGPLKAGENSFVWDGKKTNTLDTPSGGYSFTLTATDKNGGQMSVNMRAASQVVGVSFEGGDPVLLVGNPNQPEKITMSSIVKIEDTGFQKVPGAQSLGAVSAAQAQAVQSGAAAPQPQSQPQSDPAPAQQAHSQAVQKGPNFFGFQKGTGSSSLDTSKLAPEVQAALQMYEEQRAEATAQREKAAQAARDEAKTASADVASAEKGFPNGLSNGK